MRTSRAPILILLATVAGMAHPLGADLFAAQARESIGIVASAIGVLCILTLDRPRLWVALTALFAGTVLSPLFAAPICILVLARRDLGAIRYAATGLLLAICVIALWLTGVIGEAMLLLPHDIEHTSVEWLVAQATVAKSIFWPSGTPLLGIDRSLSPLLGLTVTGLCLLGLYAVAFTGIKHEWQRWLGALCALWTAPIIPSLISGPMLGYYAPLAWLLAAFLARAVVRAIQFPSAWDGRRLSTSAAIVLVTWASLSVARSSELWPVQLSESRRWTALLAERPDHSRMLWGYSQWLRRNGRTAESQEAAAVYFTEYSGDTGRRIRHLVNLIDQGGTGAAREHVVQLDLSSVPDNRRTQETILRFLSREKLWDQYFPFASSVAASRPSVSSDIAAFARGTGLAALFQKHLSVAMNSKAPSLAMFELSFAHNVEARNQLRLEEEGHRAMNLYPNSALPYAMLSRAAKLLRKDKDSVRWGLEALKRDPTMADVHYDIGLVYHGRAHQQRQAAYHYQKTLALDPDHPRRKAIAVWIRDLEQSQKIGN